MSAPQINPEQIAAVDQKLAEMLCENRYRREYLTKAEKAGVRIKQLKAEVDALMSPEIPTVDFEALSKAQAEYCERAGVPHFAPRVCYACSREIYAHPRAQTEADNTLITGCYHCHRSFCE